MKPKAPSPNTPPLDPQHTDRIAAIIHRLCARPVAAIPPTLDEALADVRAEVAKEEEGEQ